MRKVLVSAYYNLNLGDDLFLKVLAQRYPNIEWYLLTSKDEYNSVFKKYKNIKIIRTISLNVFGRKVDLFKKLNDKIFNYSRYDAFVNIGGSIFIEGKGWEHSIIERSNIPKRFNESKKPTFIIGANFGPYNNELFVEKYKRLFNYFDDVCFRDNYSYNLFKDKENIRKASDVVFSLNYEPVKKLDRTVGISVIDLSKRKGLSLYKKDYIHKMIEFIEFYLQKGYTIKLFSFCENEGDLKGIQEILGEFQRHQLENIKIISYKGDIDNVLHEFQSCETIIGTRFHSIILAILFRQNIFPIIYSEKSYNLLKDINLVDHYTYIKDIKSVDVKSKFFDIQRRQHDNNDLIMSSHNQFKGLDMNIINYSGRRE